MKEFTKGQPWELLSVRTGSVQLPEELNTPKSQWNF